MTSTPALAGLMIATSIVGAGRSGAAEPVAGAMDDAPEVQRNRFVTLVDDAETSSGD